MEGSSDDHPEMPGCGVSKIDRPDGPESCFPCPAAALIGSGPDGRRRSSGRFDIGPPVDDGSRSAGLQHAARLAQQPDGRLNVKEVEEHGVNGGSVGKAGAVFDEIPAADDQVGKPFRVGPPFGFRNHRRVDVEGVQEAVKTARDGKGERAVAAPELDHITRPFRTLEAGDDFFGIKKVLPLVPDRHPALAPFHVPFVSRQASGFNGIPGPYSVTAQKNHMIAFTMAAITPMMLRTTAMMLTIPPRMPGESARTSPMAPQMRATAARRRPKIAPT